MSRVLRSNESHSVMAGLTVDIAENSIDKAQKLLQNISGGWQQAVGSALKRAASSGKTAVKGAITQEYTISQHIFLTQTKNVSRFSKDGVGVSVTFGYRGSVIPLMSFSTRVGRGGQVTTQVKRASGAEVLESAFRAQMGSHVGIFERIGADRLPVKELYGPSTPQMMYSNEEITDAAEEAMAKTYENRIDHEIARILNGWGR